MENQTAKCRNPPHPGAFVAFPAEAHSRQRPVKVADPVAIDAAAFGGPYGLALLSRLVVANKENLAQPKSDRMGLCWSTLVKPNGYTKAP
jgi:hypothetical protein